MGFRKGVLPASRPASIPRFFLSRMRGLVLVIGSRYHVLGARLGLAGAVSVLIPPQILGTLADTVVQLGIAALAMLGICEVICPVVRHCKVNQLPVVYRSKHCSITR